MQTHHTSSPTTMGGDGAPTPGVSSRRSACDRCRVQKLRCLRSDTDSRCGRCATADSQCVTSPIYRMRNYSATNKHGDATESTSQKRRRVAQVPRDEAENLALATTTPRSGNETSIASPADFDWLLNVPLGATPSTEPANSPGFTILTWDSTVYPGATPLAAPTPISQTISWPQYDDDTLGTPSFGNFGSLGLEAPGSSVGDEKVHHYIEELSRINLDLASQMRRMVQGPMPMTLKTLIVPDTGRPSPSGDITTPVEDIITTTRQYLDVLGLIAGSPKATAHPNAPSTAVSPWDPEPRFGVESMLSEASSSISTSPAVSGDDKFAPTTPSSGVTASRSSLDSSTLLLVLVCYIHVLKLYVALFAHIREYLQLVSESEDRTIHPLPRLAGFDNFPLQSGNLQANIVIQLLTNMLERIESLLGLPRELCIGTRECAGDSLLRREGILALAESLIRREDTGRPEDGKGGVGSLQRDVRKAKELLRSRIAL
ncbi:hypothetical protein B0T16DRAFT_406620 [Cercophora newfieldiana]|uniref:Zn(2)-C6 fungal-type domain-containing protein n=1 Tax=Cercophora newfieldiana TaxID=92897 RepID=A0AA40CVY8_9PEZI|nr:hypothetical protein B0T16DRAFT_406620 [Cercophora newfieldiana]